MQHFQRNPVVDLWADSRGSRAHRLALTGGNSISLLTPSQAERELLEAVDSARNHINVETDAFPCDDLGLRLVDHMAARAHAGVRVNLLHNVAGHGRMAPVFQRLTGDSVRHSRFRPAGSWLRWITRSHEGRQRPRRMLGVDGRIGFMATGDTSEAVGWGQTRFRLEGPIVQRLQREFVANWQCHSPVTLPTARYFPPLAVVGTQGVALGPIRATGTLAPCNPWHSALLGAIEAANTSACLALTRSTLPPRLLQALLRASSRRVQVRLWVPQQPAADGRRLERLGWADRLTAAGIEVQRRLDSLAGSTICVIDQRWSSLGAGQADWRSILDRCETDLIVADEGFARSLVAELTPSNPNAADGCPNPPRPRGHCKRVEALL